MITKLHRNYPNIYNNINIIKIQMISCPHNMIQFYQQVYIFFTLNLLCVYNLKKSY